MRRRPRSRSTDGFSLLEALVGIAVIAMILIAFFESLGFASFTSNLQDQTVKAVSAARSILATFGISRALEEGQQSGTLPGGGDWHATLSARSSGEEAVSLQTPPRLLLRAYDISLTVTVEGRDYRFNTARTRSVETPQ